MTENRGVTSSDRDWADPNWQFMTNPAYVKGNGLPQFITTPNASLANGSSSSTPRASRKKAAIFDTKKLEWMNGQVLNTPSMETDGLLRPRWLRLAT